MKDRHLLPRKSHGGCRVSWARVPGDALVVYRLFRRGIDGAWHYECRRFPADVSRARIAAELWRAKQILIDLVDELDFADLGMTA